MPQKKQPRSIYVPPALRKREDTVSLCSLRTLDVGSQELDELQHNLGLFSLSDEASSDIKASSLTPKCPPKSDSHLSPKETKDVHEGKSTEPTVNYDEFKHILELYDFSKVVDGSDLQAELYGFEDSGFYLKWVDDTHCLAVFSSVHEANRALTQISGLMMKARRMPDASLASKWKLARSPGDWAMPYKKRPVTSSLTARRMISSHLGLSKYIMNSDELLKKDQQEKELLREAQSRAQAIRKAQRSIWDDDSY